MTGRRNLVGMAAEQGFLVRDVANQLGLDRAEVYRLIRTGVLRGHPDEAGDMRIQAESVETYKASTNTTPA